MTAVHLSRQGRAVDVEVFERHGVPALGVAYGTTSGAHLLNVPAGKMSALPDDPEHLLRWLQRTGAATAEPTEFIPRMVYGRYLSELFREAMDVAAPSTIIWSAAEVLQIRRESDGLIVVTGDGDEVRFDAVVLAVGSLPPSHPRLAGRLLDGLVYRGNPWNAGALDGIPQDGGVLLVGAGLTAVDLALSLDERGHRGPVHILSRRGWLPRPHGIVLSAVAPSWPDPEPSTAREWVAWMKRTVRASGDWRPPVDSLRPHTQRIWAALPIAERQRLLRHARPLWEVHRHRMPPRVAARIAALQESGRLTLHAGRLQDVQLEGGLCRVTYKRRGSQQLAQLAVSRVVNCTGPETDSRRMSHALLASLVASGMAVHDELGLGLATDASGRLVVRDGSASAGLWAVGPIRKGTIWETTAVPELRAQVVEVARALATDTNR